MLNCFKILPTCCILFFLTAPAMAEGRRPLSDKEKANLAQILQLAPNSRHFNEYIKGEPPDISQIKDYPSKVIKHIRGDGTGRFPTKEEYESERKISSEVRAKRYDELFHKYGIDTQYSPPEKKETDDILSVATELNRFLPRCENDNTDVIEYADSFSPQEVVFDVLWLYDGLEIPKDTVAAFGKHAVVAYYNPNKPDLETETAINMGVSCLPMRIRVTNTVIYRDSGRNALLNYDEDYSRSGVMHESMRELLEKR